METNGSSTNATRRDFLKTAGALGAGLVASGVVTPAHAADAAPRKVETLALNGGPKAITAPAADATKWPLYGDEEIDLVGKLLRNPGYGPIAEFEDAWKAHFGSPFAKAHCNGTSALTSDRSIRSRRNCACVVPPPNLPATRIEPRSKSSRVGSSR